MFLAVICCKKPCRSSWRRQQSTTVRVNFSSDFVSPLHRVIRMEIGQFSESPCRRIICSWAAGVNRYKTGWNGMSRSINRTILSMHARRILRAVHGIGEERFHLVSSGSWRFVEERCGILADWLRGFEQNAIGYADFRSQRRSKKVSMIGKL